MLSVKEFEEAEELKSFDHLEPGFHWCKIVSAVDHSENKDKSYVEFTFDIDNPKDKFNKFFENSGLNCKWRRYYSGKAKVFFKAFVIALQLCNKGYKYSGTCEEFVGKHVYLLFQEREYINKDGDVSKACNPIEAHSVDGAQKWLKENNNLPPKLLTLEDQGLSRPGKVETKTITEADVADEDLPF